MDVTDAIKERRTMIRISDPLDGSKPGVTTMHYLFKGQDTIGRVNVSYIQEDEVKTFRKYTKRRLIVGQPFGVQVIIDALGGKASAESLGREGICQIIKALKDKFKGLEERDIFILELNSEGRKIVGRGSEFPV
jgi:hypothetical protein